MRDARHHDRHGRARDQRLELITGGKRWRARSAREKAAIVAEAVALLATHPEPLAQYAAVEGGLGRITDRVAPLIAVPTTAGTGSEVGRAALINLVDGRKLGLVSPHLIPKRAICEPDLTLGLPPYLTATTGMDALSHCIETFLSPRFNPPAEAIALDGAGRIMRFLERAFADG